MEEPEIGGNLVVEIEGIDDTCGTLFFHGNEIKQHGGVDDSGPVYRAAGKAGGNNCFSECLKSAAIGFALFFKEAGAADREKTFTGVGILRFRGCSCNTPVGGAGQEPVEE